MTVSGHGHSGRRKHQQPLTVTTTAENAVPTPDLGRISVAGNRRGRTNYRHSEKDLWCYTVCLTRGHATNLFLRNYSKSACTGALPFGERECIARANCDFVKQIACSPCDARRWYKAFASKPKGSLLAHCGWVRTTFGGLHWTVKLVLSCNPPKMGRTQSTLFECNFPCE